MALESARGLMGELAAQRAPADPRATPTEMITRGLGGMLGVDARTQPEVLQDRMSAVDPDDPDALEDQLTAMVKSPAVPPEKKMQAVQALQKIKQKKQQQKIAKAQRAQLAQTLKDTGKGNLAPLVSSGAVPLQEAAKLVANPKMSDTARRLVEEGKNYGSKEFKAGMAKANKSMLAEEGMKDKDVADLYTKFTPESVQAFLQDNSSILVPLDEETKKAASTYGKILTDAGVKPGTEAFQRAMLKEIQRERQKNTNPTASNLTGQAVDTYEAILEESDEIPEDLRNKYWLGIRGGLNNQRTRIVMERAEHEYENNPSLGRAGALKKILQEFEQTGDVMGTKPKGPVKFGER